MRTTAFFATLLSMLAIHTASAAEYSVDVTANPPTTISIDRDTEVTHTFTIKNTGSKDDTYTLHAESETSWADENSIPATVSIAASGSAVIPLTIFVPSSTNANARGSVSLAAVSNSDHIASNSKGTVYIQLEGADPIPNISGPDTGETGEMLSFVLTGVDDESVINSRAFEFLVDWGDGIVNDKFVGRADGTYARHSYKEPGTFTILVKATDGIHLTSATTTGEITITGDSLSTVIDKRKSSRISATNPCSSKTGLSLYACLNDFRMHSSEIENIASRRDVRTARFMRGNVGRRSAALRDRLSDIRNKISPFLSRQKSFRGRTDPRPASQRASRVGNKRSGIIKAIEKRRSALRSRNANLKRSQTEAGNRESAVMPLCARRNGLRLIGCLLELGIEINRWTADEDTLKIWEDLKGEISE